MCIRIDLTLCDGKNGQNASLPKTDMTISHDMLELMRRAQFSSFVHFAARLLGACPTRFRLRFNRAVEGEHDGCGIINGVAVLSLSSSLCLVET